jgi:hypothetical protein
MSDRLLFTLALRSVHHIFDRGNLFLTTPFWRNMHIPLTWVICMLLAFFDGLS